MNRITGKIESFEYRRNGDKEKKVVTLVPDSRQRLFIEFRGRKMDELAEFKENQNVTIDFFFEGTTSKNSGIQFNNIIANKITLCDV